MRQAFDLESSRRLDARMSMPMVQADERDVAHRLPISDDRGRFVIVFVIWICYVADMGRSLGHGAPVRHTSGFRRGMLIMLAFVYLFVGLAHTVTCVEKAVASTMEIDAAMNAVDTDGGAPEHTTVIGDHCHSCVPGILSAPPVAEYPAVKPAKFSAVTVELVHTGPQRLDTPPPKNLI